MKGHGDESDHARRVQHAADRRMGWMGAVWKAVIHRACASKWLEVQDDRADNAIAELDTEWVQTRAGVVRGR
jgi:hypothetical protein